MSTTVSDLHIGCLLRPKLASERHVNDYLVLYDEKGILEVEEVFGDTIFLLVDCKQGENSLHFTLLHNDKIWYWSSIGCHKKWQQYFQIISEPPIS